MYMNGTSMATPYIAGAVSLARSFRPDLSYIDIKQAIFDSAEQVPALLGYVAS
jgi:subtilisin family serine protease